LKVVGDLLIVGGLIALVLAVIGLFRGHLDWARIASRKSAGIWVGASFVVLIIGGALSPAPKSDKVTQDAEATPSATPSLPFPAPPSTARPTSSHTPPAPSIAPTTRPPAPAVVLTTAPVRTTTPPPPPPPPVQQALPPAPVVTTEAPPPPSATSFANCTEMHTQYPHGVGLPGATDHTSGTPVTDFYVSTDLYNANSGSDRDGDGIACEKA
jgi:hypothetical protein